MNSLTLTYDTEEFCALKTNTIPNKKVEILRRFLLYFSVIKDCDYILHVASPWPVVADKSTVDTAVNGTMNVLRAAADEPRIRKIVMTSSCAAINGRILRRTMFMELSPAKSNVLGMRKLY